MGFFDDIFGQPFGGMFDMNGDGKTDLGEEWLGYMVINECMKEDEENSYSGSSFYSNDDFWQLDCEDGSAYGLSPYDYESKLEYEAALKFAKIDATCRKNDWRDYCEDGLDYGIDPEDFDSEDEYNEALEEAKGITATYDYETESGITIPVNLTFSIVRPGQEHLDKIKEEDYPTKRQYDAAYYLCELQQDIGYVPYNSTKEAEIEKCNFILSAETVASKYLTISDGFLFVQAIKENFELPVVLDDEDENVVHDFNEVFMQVAEENPKLAVDIWTWVIKEFGPFKKYMSNDWTVFNSILTSTDDYPDEFLPLVIKRLGEDIKFCDELITKNPQYPYGMSTFITKALELDLIKEAQIIFTAVAMNTHAKVKDMENLISTIIMDCSNWEELETIEKFKYNILPIIKKMNSKRIQRLYPKFENDVDEYIRSVECSEEKYQYSRRFEWRAKYKESPLYDIDPLDYESEADYLNAAEQKKYAWRRYQYEARRYGIDVNAFETEDEYKVVLNQKREEAVKARNEERAKAKPKPTVDPLAATDKTVYNFCSVIFNASNQPYTYLIGDLDIKIGDKVVVPVGNDNTERVATVVSTSQHMRLTAPFPVDKAKKVIRKVEE